MATCGDDGSCTPVASARPMPPRTPRNPPPPRRRCHPPRAPPRRCHPRGDTRSLATGRATSAPSRVSDGGPGGGTSDVPGHLPWFSQNREPPPPPGLSTNLPRLHVAQRVQRQVQLAGGDLGGRRRGRDQHRDLDGGGVTLTAGKETVSERFAEARQEMLKSETACMILVRLYDIKGKNQLRVEMPVIIAKPGEQMLLSKTVNLLNGDGVVSAGSAIVKIRQLDVTTDTSIRVSPKMAYLSLDMKSIEGTSMTELLSGKESFWVYDNNLAEIKIPDKQLKQVKGSMEDNLADYLSKIPFRLKSLTGKSFFIRFRWVSTDRKKVIDIVVRR